MNLLCSNPEEQGFQPSFNGKFYTKWLFALNKQRPIGYETEILKVLTLFQTLPDKLDLIRTMVENTSNIRNFTKNLSKNAEKAFVIKIAQFLKAVLPPSLAEIKRQNYNYNSVVYEKMLEFEETLGPNIIFQSDQTLSGQIIVKTKNDWISIFQDGVFLMSLDPFEYVGITASKATQYELPTNFVVGETVAIVPAFLLHWLLQYEERAQELDDIATLADIGFTLTTLGTYAAGKTAIVVGGKFAIAAIVDMVLQVGLSALGDNDFDEALKNIDYSQVFYSGAECLIKDWETQAVLGCIRSATVQSLKDQSFNLSVVASSCIKGAFYNAVSHKAFIKGSFLSNKLEQIVKIAPRNVVKNMKEKLGFNRDMVEWIAAHTGFELHDHIFEFYN